MTVMVQFNENSTAYVMSFQRDVQFGNVPVTVLGRNRNDYQNSGLGLSTLTMRLYVPNLSHYRALMKDLYQHKEIKMTIYDTNESYNLYVVPTSIHRKSLDPGRSREVFRIDTEFIETDPLRYKTKYQDTNLLVGTSGTFGSYVTIGNKKTAASLAFDVYDKLVSTHSYSSAGQSLSFGRRDELGFNHLYKSGMPRLPRYSGDKNDNFWGDNRPYWDRYFLPPLNITSGNCSWKYVAWCDSDNLPYYGYIVRYWEWGIGPFMPLETCDLEGFYAQDGSYANFPYPIFSGREFAPQFYWIAGGAGICEYDFDDHRAGLGCDVYLDPEEVCTNSGMAWYYTFYGRGKYDGSIDFRLSYAMGALFVDLYDDYNIDRIVIESKVDIPVYSNGEKTEGVNLFVWDRVNETWNPLVARNLDNPRIYQGYRNINYTIDDNNYSSNWNISGGIVLLFASQVVGDEDPGVYPPWDHWVDDYTVRSGGMSYLRLRVYRKQHRLGTILRRHLDHCEYIKIRGINNIPNNTVVIDIVNASSNHLGEFVYRSVKVAGGEWQGEHVIPTATIPFPANASYFGVIIRLETELVNPSVLPQVELYYNSESLVSLVHGGTVVFYAGSYGNCTETPIYYDDAFPGKTFVKEYREFSTLKSLTVRNVDEKDRVAYLAGDYIYGHYELNNHGSDRYTFDAFVDPYKSYLECSEGVSISDNSITLNNGWITYLICPNAGIIETPMIHLSGSDVHVLISLDNEHFYETPIRLNQTSYLGSSELDLRGNSRFYLRLAGGNFNELVINCNLGSTYNPLPWIYPGLVNIMEYEKDCDIDVFTRVTYEDAYI